MLSGRGEQEGGEVGEWSRQGKLHGLRRLLFLHELINSLSSPWTPQTNTRTRYTWWRLAVVCNVVLSVY